MRKLLHELRAMLAVELFGLATRLDVLAVQQCIDLVNADCWPVEDERPRCPDCRTGPDVGDNCPICAERAEAQRRDMEMYNAGWDEAAARFYPEPRA